MVTGCHRDTLHTHAQPQQFLMISHWEIGKVDKIMTTFIFTNTTTLWIGIAGYIFLLLDLLVTY